MYVYSRSEILLMVALVLAVTVALTRCMSPRRATPRSHASSSPWLAGERIRSVDTGAWIGATPAAMAVLQVFGRRSMTENSKRKIPPTEGRRSHRNKLLEGLRGRGPLAFLIAPGLLLAPLIYAGQSRCPATWPPSVRPC